MTEDDRLAQKRYFIIAGVRLAATAGAVFGLILLGRAQTTGPRLLGAAIVLSALAMIATVPRSLAHRWRTPPQS